MTKKLICRLRDDPLILQNLWKLAVIIILLESYCLWVETFKVNRVPHHSIHDPFLSEKGFYLSCAQIIVGESHFLL